MAFSTLNFSSSAFIIFASDHPPFLLQRNSFFCKERRDVMRIELVNNITGRIVLSSQSSSFLFQNLFSYPINFIHLLLTIPFSSSSSPIQFLFPLKMFASSSSSPSYYYSCIIFANIINFL